MAVAALRPLRHRSFALVWGAGFVSNVGTWMQTVAVGSLVTGITGNPAWTALSYVASFLPNGVLAPVGGALADKVDRRTGILVGVVVEAAIAALLAVLVAAGHNGPVLITGLVFLAGCVSAVRLPFQQAVLPDLVPREDLVGAISLGSAQWNLGRVVGPAIAGVVIVVGSFTWAFALNAASFLAVVVAFLLVRLPPHEAGSDYPGLVAHLRAGMGAARREAGVRSALVLIAVAASTVAVFMSLLPAMAAVLVDGGAKEIAGATGVLTTGQGIGAVAGALLLPSLAERFGRRQVLTFMLVASPVALVPFALSPSVGVAAVTVALVGGAYICVLSGLSAVVQLRAPAALRGRLLSLYFAVLSITFPIGAVAQGTIADVVGLRPTFVGAAVVMLVAVAVLRLTRPGLFTALDDPPEPQPEVAVVTDVRAAEIADAAG